MTIPMDCSICYAAGRIFALSAKDSFDDTEYISRCINRGRILVGCAIIPASAYFVARWPEWSWMYFNRKRARSIPLVALALGSYFISHDLGFESGLRSIERDSKSIPLEFARSFLPLAIISALLWKRFRYQGTFEEFEEGEAVDVLRNLQFLIPFGVASFVVILAGALVVLRNMSHKVERRIE